MTKKFKVGDQIIGLKEASARYRTTGAGWKGTVTHVHESNFSATNKKDGEFHTLLYKYFKLMKAKTKTAVKSKKLFLRFDQVDDLTSFEDFDREDIRVYRDIKDAVDDIDSTETEYIVEVEIKSVKTNRTSVASLTEVKL